MHTLVRDEIASWGRRSCSATVHPEPLCLPLVANIVSAPYPRRHPFFASANRSGGPTKGDIQLFTCKADTLLSQLLHKVGYFT